MHGGCGGPKSRPLTSNEAGLGLIQQAGRGDPHPTAAGAGTRSTGCLSTQVLTPSHGSAAATAAGWRRRNGKSSTLLFLLE